MLISTLAFAVGLLLLPSFPTQQVGRAPSRQGASGAIAIIVHQSNPVNTLSSLELRRIFMLETQSWPHGRRITLVLRQKGQMERREAIRLITGLSETEYDRHVLYQTFRGLVGWGPRSILSSQAMVRFVFNAPGAVGYVPAEETDDTIKVLRIDGRLPADPDYPLKRRVRVDEPFAARR